MKELLGAFRIFYDSRQKRGVDSDMKNPILSISIPTYNRIRQLEELIRHLLSFSSDEIEVVVTDNKSQDGTVQRLLQIKDNRLKIYENKEAVPGYYNMILGLYHASGKYVMHCNDRDWIYTEALTPLLQLLEKNDYSYISTTRHFLEASGSLTVYGKGYDSILNQKYTRHPTGMIFHTGLMHKYLPKEHYRQFVDDTFTYCFLMREIMVYEKSAILDNGCWNERHSRVKLQLCSGSVYKGGLYFEPDRITVFMQSVCRHLLDSGFFTFTDRQRKKLLFDIIAYFKKQLILKKICYADKRECRHYGIKKKFVSVFEMKRIYRDYLNHCDNTVKKYISDKAVPAKWETWKDRVMSGVCRDCIQADIAMIKKQVKRMTDSDYPY